MLARCSKCGAEINRYWCNTWGDPCPNCGSVVFWVFHISIDPLKKGTECLMDVAKNERLSEDRAYNCGNIE